VPKIELRGEVLDALEACLQGRDYRGQESWRSGGRRPRGEWGGALEEVRGGEGVGLRLGLRAAGSLMCMIHVLLEHTAL